MVGERCLLKDSLVSLVALDNDVETVLGVGYANALKSEVLSFAFCYLYLFNSVYACPFGYESSVVGEYYVVAVESEPADAVPNLLKSEVAGVVASVEFSVHVKKNSTLSFHSSEVVFCPGAVSNLESFAETDLLAFAADKLEYVVGNLLEHPFLRTAPAVHVAAEVELDTVVIGLGSGGGHCDCGEVACYDYSPVAFPGTVDVGACAVAGFESYDCAGLFTIVAGEDAGVEAGLGIAPLAFDFALGRGDLESLKTVDCDLIVAVYDCELSGV